MFKNKKRTTVVIAAPASYFDLTGLNYDESSLSWIPEPKDPIVAYHYKNGYIILTSWIEK